MSADDRHPDAAAHRIAHGLAHARDREHVERCAECRAELGIAEAFARYEGAPGDAARAASIAAAIRAAAERGARGPARRARTYLGLSAAAALPLALVLAGAAAAAIWLGLARDPTAPDRDEDDRAAAPADVAGARRAGDGPRPVERSSLDAPRAGGAPAREEEVAPRPAADASEGEPPPAAPGARPAEPPARGELVRDARAAALFEEATAARRAGDAGQAITLYRALEARYPSAPEAHASLVIAGRLLLDRLENPGEALRRCQRYLRRGGELAEEALLCVVDARRGLGQAAQEREALVEFLTRYPDSLHAARLRARVAELE